MGRSGNRYSGFSKEQLIQRIEEIEEVLCMMEKDENNANLLSLPWVGNLGHWNWMVQSNQLVFNEKKATNLGYDRDEIPENIGFEYFTTKLHPDDYERVMDNMRNHLMNLSDSYEVEYRIRDKSGNYAWYYDTGKVTKRNKSGDPIVVSGLVFDISITKIMESKLKEANTNLKHLVITDELTSAYNRRFMEERIEEEIQNYKMVKSSFSLIMFDIDNFKGVNDNYGHGMGDKLLKKIVETVTNMMTKESILSRFGGDEFIILLPENELFDAVIFAQKVRDGINNIVIGDLGKVTVSIGVITYSEGDSIDDALKKVDDFMYKAKAEGGNCVKKMNN